MYYIPCRHNIIAIRKQVYLIENATCLCQENKTYGKTQVKNPAELWSEVKSCLADIIIRKQKILVANMVCVFGVENN
jgi:hypothetical protein